ncbi:MAG: hypothetical protein A2Z03_10865 [Chloroflexi bacterium RBG_16_56_8]|nr:MAG: hypothetical protein A2Z03_10865 [Chloroflexi bacterium RBG_16_56_8]
MNISSIVIAVVGIVITVFFTASYNRYKDVFDYEKTFLWHREMNGKQVREILKNIIIAGAWLILIGAGFYIIISVIS